MLTAGLGRYPDIRKSEDCFIDLQRSSHAVTQSGKHINVGPTVLKPGMPSLGFTLGLAGTLGHPAATNAS